VNSELIEVHVPELRVLFNPLEIFLYDWWPILAERKLYDRLSAMPVRITFRTAP
jgi:hypothetical protein